jgi:hypothetical protein
MDYLKPIEIAQTLAPSLLFGNQHSLALSVEGLLHSRPLTGIKTWKDSIAMTWLWRLPE